MKLPNLRVDVEALFAKHKESECKHTQVELRKKLTANGGVMIREQCTICGSPRGKTRRKAEFTVESLAALPNWDEALKNNYYSVRSDTYTKMRANADAEIRAEWLKQYNAYLQTPEWTRKSALVLKRDKHHCQGCLSAAATQAHHLSYAHAGEEFLFELVAVCDACHDRLHSNGEDDDTDEQVPF